MLPQACRGDNVDSGMALEIETDGKAATVMNPVTADFITMSCTVPGMCELRTDVVLLGTLLIQ